MNREIESTEQLAALLDAGAPLGGTRWQGVDLRPLEDRLLATSDLHGVAVLGGTWSAALGAHLSAAGAWVFPTPADLPVDPYRARLYAPDELYAGLGHDYGRTPDAQGYAWAQRTRVSRDPLATALQAIHDDGMTDALEERLAGVAVAGIMGGHAADRGTPTFAAAARLGHRLAAAGLTVVTGGGPGAMEAGNLGACCPDDAACGEAVRRLAVAPDWRDGIGPWAQAALALREDLGLDDSRSVSVPTWFYGHEPPNVFAGGVAKYFSNALREEILLACATAGVVVLPGAAGTVQEIFQLATRLYYAPAEERLAPLVLVGREYWCATLPAAPLLTSLGAGRQLGSVVRIVDDVDDAADVVLAAARPDRRPSLDQTVR